MITIIYFIIIAILAIILQYVYSTKVKHMYTKIEFHIYIPFIVIGVTWVYCYIIDKLGLL